MAKRKTAGYARVSTDSEEQLTSYEAQVEYYTNYIKSQPEWEFAGVYTNERISATDTRHRGGFNKIVQDALDGKIEQTCTDKELKERGLRFTRYADETAMEIAEAWDKKRPCKADRRIYYE